MKILNKIFPHFVGIDIGSASIKVMEVNRVGKKVVLKNYVYMESATYEGKPFRSFEKETLFLAIDQSVDAIKACFDAAEMHPHKVVFSLPDFSSFFISFELPLMSGGELTKAINFHASKYVPIPMDEIVLDWKQIGPSPRKKEKKDVLHILAIAIPKTTMDQYRGVANAVGVSNLVLEPEAFSLFRVFAPKDDQPLCIIDFGAKSTTLSFGDKDGLQSSHSLDVAGEKIIEVLKERIDLKEEEARTLLKKSGFLSDQPVVYEILAETMNPLIGAFNESWRAMQKRGSVLDQRPNVILVGGLAGIPGMSDYLKDALNTNIQIGNPMAEIEYPPALGPIIREIGPAFGVAAGASMRVF